MTGEGIVIKTAGGKIRIIAEGTKTGTAEGMVIRIAEAMTGIDMTTAETSKTGIGKAMKNQGRMQNPNSLEAS